MPRETTFIRSSARSSTYVWHIKSDKPFVTVCGKNIDGQLVQESSAIPDDGMCRDCLRLRQDG